MARVIRGLVESSFSQEELRIFREIDKFLESVTSISSILKVTMTEKEKTLMIKKLALKIVVPKIAYLPTNPTVRVIGIDCNSGRPM